MLSDFLLGYVRVIPALTFDIYKRMSIFHCDVAVGYTAIVLCGIDQQPVVFSASEGKMRSIHDRREDS